MKSALIDEALRVLSGCTTTSLVTRDLLVAFATLAAWVQHWPSSSSVHAKELIQKFAWIREAENDRYIKQRRIAISRLAGELNPR